MNSLRITRDIDTGAAVDAAVRTLETEQSGIDALLDALKDGLGAPFAEAARVLAGARGRVIVTGIGKSGHVGNKIAATLSSTGTPATFVHPVEANHGDLGTITPDDAIIALSWSGESAELKGIVSYSRRFSIPLVAITANPTSALGKAADVVLALPRVEEACPHGLAPTTSTTMQLVLGDALAIALLEARGFTPEHFRTFHPGGQLGANLTRVGDIMHTGEAIPLVKGGTSLPNAVRILAEKRFGCVGIIDGDGDLIGIITDGDLARNITRNLADLMVEDLMTGDPKIIAEDTFAATAMEMLNRYRISALLVVRGRKPVGVLHFHDLLRIGAA